MREREASQATAWPAHGQAVSLGRPRPNRLRSQVAWRAASGRWRTVERGRRTVKSKRWRWWIEVVVVMLMMNFREEEVGDDEIGGG